MSTPAASREMMQAVVSVSGSDDILSAKLYFQFTTIQMFVRKKSIDIYTHTSDHICNRRHKTLLEVPSSVIGTVCVAFNYKTLYKILLMVY